MYKFERIHAIINANCNEILTSWVDAVVGEHTVNKEQEQQDCRELLKYFEACLLEDPEQVLQTPVFKAFENELKSFAKFRAIRNFSPSQTANYILELKRVITDSSLRYDNEIEAQSLLKLNDFIDKIALKTFEFYVQTREDVILSQAFALEHDTPIVKIRSNIVLMSLMGIIDTVRAQKIIEKLLNSIVEEQASIAILDMTAVPTFDTHVADNILKTVHAAKIVGAQVIISGISPNAAMTIAKIGINLNEIETFNTLESSIDFAYRKMNLKLMSA
jgi:rsbT co-antagonist protein RsbR